MSLSCGGYRGCGGTTKSKRSESAAAFNGGPNWVEDSAVSNCTGCSLPFTLLRRKHHCRHCGKIFCASCCRDRRPLPKFDYLEPVRICRDCSQMCWKAESLLLAIRTHNTEAVTRYVKGGKDCNFYTGVFPPLTIAASEGKLDLVQLLLAGGAAVHHAVMPCWWYEDSLFQTDHVGVTALHAAVQAKGSGAVARALLVARADVNARTHKGNTPLLFACNAGHVECAGILIEYGASVNAQNNADGDSCLHRAVREGHVDIVRLLLGHGANKRLLNACDMTPVHLADRLRLRSVIDALSEEPEGGGPRPGTAALPNPNASTGGTSTARSLRVDA